ncbi:hypothetical protein B0H17DRAFT_1210702 [Mycena rosella]|uniref:Uncharacterized protein n=1 Tax=Mycena rosella TaxID=1033263 RepID=A0AAD7CVR3_MYCRO|nr:hypothetical protein B0H17DRAFT_1210702 [Mycena rosella]
MSSATVLQAPSSTAFDAAYPPSPSGSTKGLYVRSRPTSIDGSVMDAPFAQFTLSPTLVPLPAHAFPLAPKRTKVYAHSTKSMYFAASSAISVRTTHTTVFPVRAVRIDPRAEAPVAAAPQRRASWLKKMVPGMLTLKRRRQTYAAPPDEDTENTPLVPGARPMHTKSFSLSSRAKPKGIEFKAKGIENHATPRARCVRSRSVSGPVYDDDELDDSMPEVREALRINARIRATGYRYELVDAPEMEEFIKSEDGSTWGL